MKLRFRLTIRQLLIAMTVCGCLCASFRVRPYIDDGYLLEDRFGGHLFHLSYIPLERGSMWSLCIPGGWLSVDLPSIGVMLQIIAAFVFVDLASGLYHYATDRGWNIRQQVELFAEHHRTNRMEGFDWQPSLAAVPILLVGLYLAQPFLIAGGVFGIAAQWPHYWAHQGSKSGIVRWLQRRGIIISPEHHARHHRGPFDSHFCIFTGWNNWWLDRLLAALPFQPKSEH
jgi:sterol desaturase/sphingolipid hydroxylase (fatty acid hydroxylase superfamily)